MRIFLDSTDFREIEKWLTQGMLDAVCDIEDGARHLCACSATARSA